MLLGCPNFRRREAPGGASRRLSVFVVKWRRTLAVHPTLHRRDLLLNSGSFNLPGLSWLHQLNLFLRPTPSSSPMCHLARRCVLIPPPLSWSFPVSLLIRVALLRNKSRTILGCMFRILSLIMLLSHLWWRLDGVNTVSLRIRLVIFSKQPLVGLPMSSLSSSLVSSLSSSSVTVLSNL